MVITHFPASRDHYNDSPISTHRGDLENACRITYLKIHSQNGPRLPPRPRQISANRLECRVSHRTENSIFHRSCSTAEILLPCLLLISKQTLHVAQAPPLLLVIMSCRRFRAHRDKAHMRLEISGDEKSLQPRICARGGTACDSSRSECRASGQRSGCACNRATPVGA